MIKMCSNEMQKRLHEVFAHVRKHYDIHTQDDFDKIAKKLKSKK